MTCLYINTSLKDVIIYLFKDGKIVENEIVTGQKYNSQFIMPSIKKVLNDTNPDEIIVSNGPGSFTGVRLGCTIAKTFAYTLNIPIYTITTIEEKAICTEESPKVIGVIDNNDYYIGIFDEKTKLIGEYKYLNKAQYSEFEQKHHVITDIEIDYEKVYNYVKKNKEPINPHAVKPIYIKKISVEK